MSAHNVKFRQLLIATTWWRWLVVAAACFAFAAILQFHYHRNQSISATLTGTRHGDFTERGSREQKQSQSEKGCSKKKGKSWMKCMRALQSARTAQQETPPETLATPAKGNDDSQSPYLRWLKGIGGLGGIASLYTAATTFRKERREKEDHLKKPERFAREQEKHRWERRQDERETEEHVQRQKTHVLEQEKLALETEILRVKLRSLDKESIGRDSGASEKSAGAPQTGTRKFHIV
ncbi:hypothetical protein [Paraburkholderia sp. DHOC27]|uniref:hypothetical protein n=1 Tax=Paraburkholderia sp. DHOC27 TaxID=2303330 RepID=UPI000E3E4DCD|nr:hypothetical protein [Paraburkholderia sp. DHOC27]RFU44519.1 hypothetical protein D0B32_28380 [Paraburkholderia sp. DHOC27]